MTLLVPTILLKYDIKVEVSRYLAVGVATGTWYNRLVSTGQTQLLVSVETAPFLTSDIIVAELDTYSTDPDKYMFFINPDLVLDLDPGKTYNVLKVIKNFKTNFILTDTDFGFIPTFFTYLHTYFILEFAG